MDFSILNTGLCICLCSSMRFLSAQTCSFSRSPAYQALLPVCSYEPQLRVWQTFFNLQENTGPVYWCRSQLLGPYSFSVVMNLCSSDIGELQFLCRHSEYSKSWVALSNFFLILLMPTAVGWLSFPWQPSSKMQGWLRDFMILRASHL